MFYLVFHKSIYLRIFLCRQITLLITPNHNDAYNYDNVLRKHKKNLLFYQFKYISTAWVRSKDTLKCCCSQPYPRGWLADTFTEDMKTDEIFLRSCPRSNNKMFNWYNFRTVLSHPQPYCFSKTNAPICLNTQNYNVEYEFAC